MSDLPDQGEIERALEGRLPAELRQHSAALASLLQAVVGGSLDPAEFQGRVARDPALARLLAALSGQQIAARDALLRFEPGAQMGDVRVESVVGGDQTQVTFNVYYEAPPEPTPARARALQIAGAGGAVIELPRAGLLYLAAGLSLITLLGSLGGGGPSLATALNLAPILIAGFGIAREARQRRARPRRGGPARQLRPSVSSGVYGGLLGGMLSGCILVAAYAPAASLGRLSEIFIFALLAGAVFGALCQAAVIGFRRLAGRYPRAAWLLSDLGAGVLGGALAGLLMGALAGWFFGLDRTPRPNVALFAVGIILGPSLVALFALFYDYRGAWRRLLNAAGVSLATTLFFLLLGLGLTRSAAVVDFFWAYFTSPSHATIILGATLFGSFAGVLVGLLVGLVLTLSRLLDQATGGPA